MHLQKQASQLSEAQMQPVQFVNASFKNELRFIKGAANDLSMYLVKSVFDHKQPINLGFHKKTSEETSSTSSFLLVLRGSELQVEPRVDSSDLGDVSLDILKSYGGEVSPCAVVAMNEVLKPTVIKQTSITPKLKSNVNDENPHLCSYIYGDIESNERITLGSTCSIVRDKSLIKDIRYKG